MTNRGIALLRFLGGEVREMEKLIEIEIRINAAP